MKMYQVIEIRGRNQETYMIGFESDAELNKWLNGKSLWENEKTYSIVAWEVRKDGFGYIDLERIWKLYGKKAA